MEDAGAVFHNWTNDPEVTRFLTWKPHQNIEVTKAVIGSWLKDYKSSGRCHWGIVLKGGSEPVGNIAVVASNGLHWAELGYCLSRAHWGQGLVTEAVRAVLAYLFEQVGVERVLARHDVDNPASGAVMQKAGLRFEETEPEGGTTNAGECCAVHRYALSRGEWQKQAC